MERLPVGATFGEWTIQGMIASGGMGDVYAAVHARYPQGVALKVLHERLHADADWRMRFNEEGLVGEMLKHPHVLSASALVEHDGRIALVLDLVAGGQTLEKVISREYASGLPAVAALRVFMAVVQGVEYLHARGIIHGDIKPDNVLIDGDVRVPESWVPKVTDFGTVALIAHPAMLAGRPAVVATPRYASPEHLDGVDALRTVSDIYCLGLLLHFLLTGRHASDARTVADALPRVSEPVPELHLVDVPESLLRLFRVAVAVDPTQRFPHCAALTYAIRDVLSEMGAPILLPDMTPDLATEVDEAPAGPGDATLAERQELSEDAPTDHGSGNNASALPEIPAGALSSLSQVTPAPEVAPAAEPPPTEVPPAPVPQEGPTERGAEPGGVRVTDPATDGKAVPPPPAFAGGRESVPVWFWVAVLLGVAGVGTAFVLLM
jgi:serine/threonine-protein kinase